jgi:uncharacterized SAM-binding protein YcdF (DUF218 family)
LKEVVEFQQMEREPMGNRVLRSLSKRFSTLGRTAIVILAALGGLIVLVTATPFVLLWGETLTAVAGPWEDPPGDVLIVLGGSMLEDGVVGMSSYWRSVYAARAFRAGGFRHVVVTGGSRTGSAVAVPMGQFLVCLGVPPAAIQVETRSTSTRENALFTKELLAGVPGRKVLLTSDYHMFRARRAFANVGLEVLPSPFPDALKRAMSWQGRWPAFLDLAVETTKIVYYYARGWI